MRPFSAPLIVLDTETTGFPSDRWSRVIEIAAVRLDEYGEIVNSFSRVVRPDILDGRADKALEINRISREEIAAADPTEQVAEAFEAWAGDYWTTAYNVAWASCVMERAMADMGPAGVLRDANRNHPRYSPDRPWLWPSLKAAAEFYQVPQTEPAHRATSDALTAAHIACMIRRRELAAAA